MRGRIVRYDSEGHLVWQAEEQCHAHALAVLSNAANRLFVYVFEWTQDRTLGPVMLEFDWTTGARVGLVPLGCCDPKALAIDENGRVLYVKSVRGSG